MGDFREGSGRKRTWLHGHHEGEGSCHTRMVDEGIVVKEQNEGNDHADTGAEI